MTLRPDTMPPISGWRFNTGESTSQAAGSMAKAKEAGHLRLEGKDYIVQDGDIMLIRFNV